MDLRLVPEQSFGAALLYFTGSKAHNIELRKIAIEKGWSLNEYGLTEGERVVACSGIVIDEEFEGAEVVVVGGSREFLGGVDDARAQGVVQRRARRDLDQLLVTALDRAFALPEMADRAIVVADDLHLDVAGVADQALDIDAVAAEGGLGLGLAARIGLLELVGVVDDAHAAAAAASDRLDHDGATGA